MVSGMVLLHFILHITVLNSVPVQYDAGIDLGIWVCADHEVHRAFFNTSTCYCTCLFIAEDLSLQSYCDKAGLEDGHSVLVGHIIITVFTQNIQTS